MIPKDRVFRGVVKGDHDGIDVIHPKQLNSSLQKVLRKYLGSDVEIKIHCMDVDRCPTCGKKVETK